MYQSLQLGLLYVRCSRAAVRRGQVKRDRISFFKVVVLNALNLAGMEEDVLASILRSNETEASVGQSGNSSLHVDDS